MADVLKVDQIDRLKVAEKAELSRKGLYGQTCFAVCRAGQIVDDSLLSVTIAKGFLMNHKYRLEYRSE